jgi:hypothetical protein
MNNNSLDIKTYKRYMNFNIFFIIIGLIVIGVGIGIILDIADINGYSGIGIGFFLLITNSIFYYINKKSGTNDTKYDETWVDEYIEKYHEKIIKPKNFLEIHNAVNAPDMRNDVWHYFNNSDNYKTVLSDKTIKSTYTTDKLNAIYNGLEDANAKEYFLTCVKEFLPITIDKKDYINLITKPIKGSNNYTTSSDINNIKTKFDNIIAEYQNNPTAPFTKDPPLEIELKKLIDEAFQNNINDLQDLINTNNTISQQVKDSVNLYIIQKHIKQRSLADA